MPSLKANNKHSILRYVIRHGSATRSQLQQHTGLSKMTISNLITEFIEDGIMKDGSRSKIDRANIDARSAVPVHIVENARLILGICIEHTALTVGVLNLRGTVLKSTCFNISTKDDNATFMRKLLFTIDYVLNNNKDGICTASISSVGPLNYKTGEWLDPLRINNGKPFNLVSAISDYLQVPVCLENDSNVAALAEQYYGKGMLCDNFVYINIENGIGAGIILNDQLYRGHNGFGGEIGHVLFHPLDSTSNKNIFFEDYASIRSILALYYERAAVTPVHPSCDWVSFIDGILSDDPVCLEVLDIAIGYLSAGLISVVNVLNPQCIIIGGKVGALIPRIIPRLKEEIAKRQFCSIRNLIIEPSSFLSNASFIGTSALAIENLWHYICPQ